ncbi:MAG: hypothetical protein K2X42_06880 [Burkholderiaceae bacterium]|nr:hypothetical protein [Burkholderiaceae bacterium]
MSAYVVPDAHINALVTYGSVHDARFVHNRVLRHIKGNEAEIASLLYIANVESVNRRYREDGESVGFKYRPDANVSRRSAVQILAACNCFDYQACEVEWYDETIGCRIIEAIRGQACRNVPGYRSAGWSISK